MQLYCSCPCFCLTAVSLEISLYYALLSEENVFQRCCEIKVISEEKTLFHRLCFHFCLCSIIISCQQGYRFCKNNITFSLLWGYTSGFVTFCSFLHHLLKRLIFLETHWESRIHLGYSLPCHVLSSSSTLLWSCSEHSLCLCQPLLYILVYSSISVSQHVRLTDIRHGSAKVLFCSRQ